MDRYSRQILVKQIGQKGQKKISEATVLIVGVGALGTYAASLLARAGVKKLILVDPDVVTLSNLQRQALFSEADVKAEKLKVFAAKDHLLKINSNLSVDAIPSPLTPELVQDNQFTICLDCLDNYTGRDLLNRLAIKNKFDYIMASCAGNYGNVMPISPTNGPCLNCVFPNLAKLKQTDCDLIGVNTALIPIISGMQVSLALHYLVDQTTINFDCLTTFDNWSMRENHYTVTKNRHCPTCQLSPSKLLGQFKKPTLRMLCGEGAFYTKMLSSAQISKWEQWFEKHNQKYQANDLFIHFNWQGRPVSLFNNGKLIMYHLNTSVEAEKELMTLKQLANEVNKEVV